MMMMMIKMVLEKLSKPLAGEIPGSQRSRPGDWRAAGLVWLGDATDCCGRFRGGKRTGRVLLPDTNSVTSQEEGEGRGALLT